jgi:hypothetical protein
MLPEGNGGIQKPFTPGALADKVREVLEGEDSGSASPEKSQHAH